MGELILCKQSIAANPYFIEDGALNIYSLEELSYYIAHNVYLLNTEFASKELCHWIGGELGARDLEKQLLDTISQQAPLHIFIGQILTYNGYLTSVEIRDVLQAIASFENKSPTECQKMRADRLMEKEKIVDAIYEYEKMLDDPAVTHGATVFEGDVWHNLGVAYGRLFFFGEASLCFEEAYKRNHKVQSLRSMLAALRCNKDETHFKELVDTYFIPQDMVDEICEEVTMLSAKEQIHVFDEKIQQALQKDEDRENVIGPILDQWKVDYNHLCRI